MFKENDYVNVRFSNGEIRKGLIKEVLNTDSFNYGVLVKDIFDREVIVYCNESSLSKYVPN